MVAALPCPKSLDVVLHVDLAVAVVVLQIGHDVRVAAVEEVDQAIYRSPGLPPQLSRQAAIIRGTACASNGCADFERARLLHQYALHRASAQRPANLQYAGVRRRMRFSNSALLVRRPSNCRDLA